VIFQKSLTGEKLTPPYANADQVAIQLNRGTSEEGGNSWEIREYNKNGELQEAFSYDFGGRFSSSNSLIYSGMQKTSGDEGTDIYSAGVSKTEQTGSKVTRSSGSGSVGIKDDNFVQPVSSNIAFNNKVCISGILREETNSNEIYSGLSYKDQDSYLPSGGYKSVSTQYVQSSLNPSLVGKTESVSAGFTQTLTSAGQIAVQTLTNWHYTLADTATGVKTIDRSADKVVNSYNYPDKKTVVNNYQNTNMGDNLRSTVVSYSEGTSTSKHDDLGRLSSLQVVSEPAAVQDLSSPNKPVISSGTSDKTDSYKYIGDSNTISRHNFDYKISDYINMEATVTKGNENFNAYNAAGRVSDMNSLQDMKVYGLNDDYSVNIADLRLWTGEASHEWNIAQNGNVKSMDYDNWAATFVNAANDEKNTITHTTGHSDTTLNERGLSVDVKDKGESSAYKIEDAVSLQNIFNGGDSVAAFSALTSSVKDSLGSLTAQKSYEERQFEMEYDRLDRLTAYKHETKINDKLEPLNSGTFTGDWAAAYAYKATGKELDGVPVVQTIQTVTSTGGKETETAQSVYKGYDFSSLTGPVTMDTVPSVEARSLGYSQLPMQADTAGGWFWSDVVVPAGSVLQFAWSKTVEPAWNYLNDNVVKPAQNYLNDNIVNPIVNWGSTPQEMMGDVIDPKTGKHQLGLVTIRLVGPRLGMVGG